MDADAIVGVEVVAIILLVVIMAVEGVAVAVVAVVVVVLAVTEVVGAWCLLIPLLVMLWLHLLLL